VATARLLQAQGDAQGALELLDEARRFYNTDFSPPVRPIPALKARVHVLEGNLDAALRWVADSGLTAEDELDYVHEFEHITLARTLLARHAADRDRLADVIALLNRLRVAAEEGGRTGSVIEVLVLLSRAHRARGDGPAAKAALEAARARAQPEGFARVFIDEGSAAPADKPKSVHSGLVEELSSRELDVLRLLRSDLSGPDIARELSVSLNTFRTHTKNIYVKLGVNNRREAVRRAAELGL
jgi:LuxR family maltose regulon positive regulatory protein